MKHTGKWVVNLKGKPEESHEIALVREDNAHGFLSFGWCNNIDKILIASQNDVRYPNMPKHKTVFDIQMAAAHEAAKQLNQV